MIKGELWLTVLAAAGGVTGRGCSDKGASLLADKDCETFQSRDKVGSTSFLNNYPKVLESESEENNILSLGTDSGITGTNLILRYSNRYIFVFLKSVITTKIIEKGFCTRHCP